MIAFVAIFLCVPETKQRTLEELDYIFAVPSATFRKYQVEKAAPWWFKKSILRRKDLPALEPLYQCDQTVASAEQSTRRFSIT